MLQFPMVSGLNLNGTARIFPNDFEGELNIVFAAFEPPHQAIIHTWMPVVLELERRYTSLHFYEFPVLGQISPARRAFIRSSMRAVITDYVARERTVALYRDKTAFLKALDMPDDQRVYALLVTGGGHVIWRSEGAFTPEKGISMGDVIETCLEMV